MNFSDFVREYGATIDLIAKEGGFTKQEIQVIEEARASLKEAEKEVPF